MKILQAFFFGIIFILGSIILLFWGEGRAVAMAKALAEGARLVISIDAAAVSPDNDGKLIHISGDAVPQGVPGDEAFGISAEGAVSLQRKVEMLQWKEESRDVETTGLDGKTVKSTEYSYEKAWLAEPVDSSSFHDATAPQNPPMPIEGETFDVATVTLGAFSIAGNKIAPLAGFKPVPLTEDETAAAAAAIGNMKPVRLMNGVFLSSDSPDAPQIGDVRVSFARGDVSRVSAIGMQQGDGLTDYTTSNGKEIFLAENGNVPADAMFKTAIDENNVLTWVLRGVGLFAMFIGFMMLMSPLTETLGNIPFIGELINGGAMLAALAMTLLLGGVVIGIGWIFFRPLLGIGIILAGVALSYGLGRLGQKRQAAAG